MGKTIFQWNLKALSNLIINTVNNRFDFLIVIEGNRGTGKSTLGFQILKRLKKVPTRIKGTYVFIPERDIIYKQKEFLDNINRRKRSAFMGDEAVLVAFNRDFAGGDQKRIIKAFNVRRDSNNIIIMCIPNFYALDTQLKSMVKLRLSVVKRGLCIMHKPHSTSQFIRDRWDSATNEKIERKWIENRSKPVYHRLTTFAGFLKFPPLTEKEEILYQGIKDGKRDLILDEEDTIDDSNDPFKNVKGSHLAEKIIEMITTGEINSREQVELICKTNNKSVKTVMGETNKILKERGQDFRIGDIFKGFEREQKVQVQKEVEVQQQNGDDDYIIDRFGVKHKKVEIPNVF